MKRKLWLAAIMILALVCVYAFAAAEGITLAPADYNEKFVQVDGSTVTVKLNQWVYFAACAPGANYIGFHALTEPYNENTVLDENNEFAGDFTTPGDMDGRVDKQWLETGFRSDITRYIVAQAHYFGDNNTETTAVSNVITLNAEYDGPIQGDISYDVPADVNTVYSTSDTGVIRWKVPKDGRLFVDVYNMTDVDYFGLYIDEDETTDENPWLADSHWVKLTDHNPGHTTRVPLTVPRCEAGGDYDVKVFAIKFGSEQKDASETIPIHVTAASTDSPVIVSMANEYQTGETLRVFAHYTNPDNIQNGAMQIVIHEKNNPDHVVYDEWQDGFDDFWNDWDCIWQGGIYEVDAYIFQEGQTVREYYGVKEFTVTSNGGMPVPQVTPFAAMTAGEDLELDLSVAQGEEVKPEWYYYILLRADWGYEYVDEGRGENADADGNGTITIPADQFEAGGQYYIRLFSIKPGYDMLDENAAEFKFAVMSADAEESLTLTVNGSADGYQEALSSSDLRVKVDYGTGPRPTAVRIVNGDHMETWWGAGESFERNWSFGDEKVILYAEACYDEIDFDGFDDETWEHFDWGTLHWTGKSNVIVLDVSSPNGAMQEPNFTIDNPEMAEGGSGVIPWGDDLIINILDDGPTHENGQLVPGAWIFLNIDVERTNEFGDTWWDRVNQDWGYDIHSGINRIPTYNLEGGCRYRLELGADGEGYECRSRRIEFELGERDETEPVSYFTVNGGTDDIEVPTHTNLQLAAYRTGADWCSVDITKADDEGWSDGRDENRNGMLISNWRSDSEGVFTLTAYACYEGTEERDEIGSITVTVTAEDDLGELGVTMADKAYVGEQLTITFDEVENAEEYSYWLHSDNDGWDMMNGSRATPGTLTIDTGRLDPGVYWVETDAMATGYNQSHGTLHFALIDGEEKDYSAQDNSYYLSVEKLNITTEEDSYIVAYIPGAEEIRLEFRKDDNEETEEFDHRGGPGIRSGLCRGDAGDYRIYIAGRFEGNWGGLIDTGTTVSVEAENTFAADPAVTVNGSAEGFIVPADDENPQKITIEIERDENAQGYHVVLRNCIDGWHIFDHFIDLNRPAGEENERVTVGEDSILIEIDDGAILQGRTYQLECWAHAPNYECRGCGRDFLLLREDSGLDENLVLTVNGQSEAEMEILSSSNAHVKVEYNTEERPSAIRVLNGNDYDYWWTEEDNFERDWGWGEGTVYLYAEAAWGDIDLTPDDFSWERDVNWSGKSNLIQVNITNPYGEMREPECVISNMDENGVIPWGDDLIINIADDGPTDSEGAIVGGGWFFMHLHKEHHTDEGDPYWEQEPNSNYSLFSGDNYIPTYHLEGGCLYRIEIGADARGYSGRSTSIEFRLGEEPQEHNEIRSFTVNGESAGEHEALTGEEIQLAVYKSGAEWYNIAITREDDEGWHENVNDRGNGILYETWNPNLTGTYHLKAYAYGHWRDEQGEIVTDDEGNDFWEDEIGEAIITVDTEGTLAQPWVDMPMLVNAGEDIHLNWHLDGAAEYYNIWISYENEGRNLYNDRRNIAEIRREIGDEADIYDMVIPAGTLEANRVYHVHLDTQAIGYEQGHDDRTLYILGESETDGSITISGPETLVFSEYFPIEVHADDADEIQVYWEAADGWRGSDGGHAVQYYLQDWVPGPNHYQEDENGQKYIRFYAFARYNNRLKVSPMLDIPFSTENVEYAEAPGLSIGNISDTGTISRGEFIEAVVTGIDDPDVTEYKVFIADENGNWIDFVSGEAGTLLLPTNYLEVGQTYNLQACATVPGRIRTDSTPISFAIAEAEENRFYVSKTQVEVGEPLTVSVVAPGAERIRFSGGYGNWWDDRGWEGDSWYSNDVKWEMSEDPDILICAEAWYPNAEAWTPVGEEHIKVTARGRLEQPVIDVPAVVPAGQDLNYTINEVTDADFYRVEIWRNDGGSWYFDAESGMNTIPAWVLYEGGYRFRVTVLALGYNAVQIEQELYVEPIRPEIRIDSVVSNTSALDIQVPLVENGTEYELAIHYVPADDPDDFEASYVYRETLHEDDAVNGILTFTVAANTLRVGMTHWIDCYVSGDKGFFCENAKAILVRNGQADSNISISVNGDTSGTASVLIHDDFRVTVDVNTANGGPEATAIKISCGDMQQCFYGNHAEAIFNEWQTYPETLYAQACYDALPEGDFEWDSLTWSAPSNPVVITFYAIGQVGTPECYMPDSVMRGDILVLSSIYEGEHANETHANIYSGDPWSDEEGEWVYGDNWLSWNEEIRSIYLSTSMLEPGRYWVALDNSGIGYTGNRRWKEVQVTAREEQPANSVILSVPAKVEAGLNVPVSVYAPGALQVGFGIDLSETERQNPEKYEIRNGEIFYNMDEIRFDEPGNHTVTACALFTEGGTWTLLDQQIAICDPLRFNLSGMPGFFTIDQTDASVTIPLPENAQRMDIQVDVYSDNYWKEIYRNEEELVANTTIQIDQKYLQAGNEIQINFQAKADTFRDCGDGIRIPVTTPQGSMATLSLRTGDIGNIWSNEIIEFQISPAAGKTLTAVRFFEGNDWWEAGNAITPEDYPDWFDNGSAFFKDIYDEEPDRILTAFAEVQVAGSSDWTRTNVLQFTVKSDGRVGRFGFEDHSRITVPRGKAIEVAFSGADGADYYWAYAINTRDNCDWHPNTWNDEGSTTVRISTSGLEPGTYRLIGLARGYHRSTGESDGYVMLTITNATPAMPTATFKTPEALTTIEEEAFAGIGAEVVEISGNVTDIHRGAFADSRVKTVIFRNGSTWVDSEAFGGCGTITVYGERYSEVYWWAETHGFTVYPLSGD